MRGRKTLIFSFLRLGCTRFDNNTTSNSHSGSIHSDVPV